MKRAIVCILCLVMSAGVLAGCGSRAGGKEVMASPEIPDEKVSGSEKTGDDKIEEEQNNDQKNETEEVQTEQKDTEDKDAEKKDMSEDLTMTALKNNGGTVDYTNLEELNLEPGSHIAVVVKTTKTGYWTSVKKGMDAAVKDLNEKMEYKGEEKIKLSFEGPSDEKDVESQINIIDAVLAENPSVLCLAAIDMESCQAQLETAEENGIPVVVLDSGVKSGTVNTVCSTDNYNAGVEAAKKLAEAIGDEGEIAVMAHLKSSESGEDRTRGFTEEITANHPNIKIVNVSNQNEETSIRDMADSVLTLFPALKGYFCTNETTGAEVLASVKASGKSVAVVGFDAGKQQKEAIKNGDEIGVIAQNPYGMGYATIVAAARAEMGLENDSFIHSGYQWIDVTSLEDERFLNYLYE